MKISFPLNRSEAKVRRAAIEHFIKRFGDERVDVPVKLLDSGGNRPLEAMIEYRAFRLIDFLKELLDQHNERRD